ncbi:MAG: tetratricopeptide repeat protein [Cyanobacteria bacterium SIG32]|nr:tetratricopeptide repeat protein [Cyanobacteria bacterium SIG32]
MIKKAVSLISLSIACCSSAYALDINDLIKPANPLENSTQIEQEFFEVPQKVTLTRNDIHNQYAIAMNRFIQSNVRAAYIDFQILIENTSPIDYMYLQLTEKMADLGFFNLSELAISKLADDDISYLLTEDVKKYYFPATKLNKEDELYFAEMYSNIVYNDQSREVTTELLKNTTILEKYDYANYIAALGCFKADNIPDAEKYIQNAISKNPTNLNYKKLQAEILSQSAKPQNALKIISQIKSTPMQTTEFNRKIESLEQYILYKTEKDLFDKKYHLAYYFYLENELNKAMRTLQTAFNTQKKHNKKIYALLSRVYYDLKEFEKAEDNATKAYKIDRSNAICLKVLGDLAYKNGFYKNALSYYSKAKTTAEIQLARTYQKINRAEKAFEIYSKILKTTSDNYEAYYEMALIDRVNETEYLKKSLAINPKFKDAWIDLARVEIEKNNFDNASSYLAISKYIDENDFRYYYYQGLVYKNKGLPADAKRCFRKSLKLNPNYLPAKEELSI